MSTVNEREAALRRALHAAADAIEPGMDGLERIQVRLHRPRPLAIAWAEAVWTDLRLRTPSALHSWFDGLVSALSLAWERFGPTPGRSGSRAARTMSWLRPMAALGVTVSIVAAGAYIAIDGQQAFFQTGANSLQGGGSTSGPAGSARGSGGTNAHGQSPFGFAPGATPSTTCKKASHPRRIRSTSPSIGIIQSPSPGSTDSTGGSSSPPASVTPPPDQSPTPTPATGSTGPAGGAPTSTSPAPAHSRAPKPSCGKTPVTRNPVIHQPALQAPPQATPTPTGQPTPQTSQGIVSVGKLN